MDIINLIESKHAGQYRNQNDGDRRVPYYDHLYGVASIVATVLDISKEILDESLRLDMIQAALGHDLLEDTDVTEAEILSVTNSRTLSFIKELTNPMDDAHTDLYMEQISVASEEARIIKYADLIENTMSVAYNLNILGEQWVDGFYRPILKRTSSVLQKSVFSKYPGTAAKMRELLKTDTELLFEKERISFRTITSSD